MINITLKPKGYKHKRDVSRTFEFSVKDPNLIGGGLIRVTYEETTHSVVVSIFNHDQCVRVEEGKRHREL